MVLTGLMFSTLALASCASAPESPRGAAQVRSTLTALQNNPDVADHARLELREAEAAVLVAEQPLTEADAALGEHRVYMADRTVSIAEARAATRYAEAQRARLAEERETLRLQARTLEADRARDDASLARNAAARSLNEADRARDDASLARDAATRSRNEANQARDDASRSRNEATRARSDASQARSATDAAQRSAVESTALAARQAEEYQRQIDDLQAEVTDRGLVLSLGDVLFATGSADLVEGMDNNLDNLVGFLNQYPERRVQIEGHTDNMGDSGYNQGLSQRRADSVSGYLARHGIATQRLSAAGIGMDRPVASNDTATGRQQNRRVEIIIENPQ
jgi:outer membrane protein OmpA-like peptidoglycan-associated protein